MPVKKPQMRPKMRLISCDSDPHCARSYHAPTPHDIARPGDEAVIDVTGARQCSKALWRVGGLAEVGRPTSVWAGGRCFDGPVM